MLLYCRCLSVFLSVLLAGSSYAKTFKLSQNQVLHIGNGVEPRELDPTLVVGVSEAHIINNLFEGLTRLQEQTLEPQAAMAESWTISQDAKTYTFKIRKDAKWSDGVALSAEDFVWSWRRALDPLTAAEYAYQLYWIENAEAFNKGEIKDPNQIGVRAIDAQTLEVRLVSPTPFFLKLTALATLAPVPQHVVKKYPGQSWTTDVHMVSNGPFQLKEWKLQRHIRLVPNPFYWDRASVKLQGLVFYPIENLNTEEKMFLSGRLHLTHTVPPLRIPFYKEQAQTSKSYSPFKLTPLLGSYFYRFNTTRKPLNDLRVRRALALTIDRRVIVDSVVKAGQLPAGSLTPKIAGYSYQGPLLPDSPSAADIKEARKLLAQAGYPDGKGFGNIEILYNTQDSNKKTALAIQSMWKKHLNIDVVLFNQEWKVFLDATQRMDYDIARAGWVGDYPDPNTFLDMFVTNGTHNLTGWGRQDYDREIHLAGLTMDSKARYQHFERAEAMLMRDVPILPIYFYTYFQLASERVKKLENGVFQDWSMSILQSIVYKNFVLVDAL